MRLQFLGAARQVTGSQYFLDAGGSKLLVDCGMYQEREFLARNWEPSRVPPKKLDAVLVTHAHVDHCGLLPKLVGEGFRGAIYTTAASADLIELVLRDSAKIQAEDAAYKKRRHRKERRKAKHSEEPLYTLRDVERTLPLLEPISYEQETKINDNTSVVLHDAGHILGSAIVEVRMQENGRQRRAVFSGDLGQRGKPIVRDPAVLVDADVIVMESTYGGRDHEYVGDVESQMAEAINRTADRGGKIVVPIFAIERAQEFVYHVSRLLHHRHIPRVPVYLDSPMAADATQIFRRHRECFDLEAWQLICDGNSPFRFPELVLSRSTEDSKAINRQKGPAIIMSTSGMCTAGRIKFHLRQNIGKPENTILFVGYQARGTLGRQILDGRQDVRIHGRQFRVKAEVARIHGFSGHADQGELMRWLKYFQEPPQQLFLVHGEEEEADSMAQLVGDQLGWEVTVPEYRQAVEV